MKDLVFSANLLWAKGSKEAKVTVKMDDLAMFSFADGNITGWLDREDLECSYSLDSGEGASVISYEEAKLNGVGEFCLRLLLIPTAHSGASVFVAAHPLTKQGLKDRLGEHASSLLTPHITLQVQEVSANGVKAGRAAHALFTRRELANDGYGMGVLPWLECSAEGVEDVTLPDGDEVKEATLCMLRKSTAAALSTTVASLETRMRSLLAGKAGPLKNPPHVFPEFSPSVDGAGPEKG